MYQAPSYQAPLLAASQGQGLGGTTAQQPCGAADLAFAGAQGRVQQQMQEQREQQQQQQQAKQQQADGEAERKMAKAAADEHAKQMKTKYDAAKKALTTAKTAGGSAPLLAQRKLAVAEAC